jgi:glycosyltransferase involved in cell wall biosynthesis
MTMASVGNLAGLRIAHLIESDGPGGAERVVADLATTLQAAGAHNVAFLPADGEGWLARQMAGSGVEVEHFRLPRPISPACARAFAVALRRHRINVAHSHEFSMAVYGAWASWRAGVQHVITMHGSRYYAGRPLRLLAMRAAVVLSGRTVAVSHRLADHLSRDLRIPRSEFSMLSNGVRHTCGAPSTAIRGELGLTQDDRLLVAVGNLYEVKGHRYLIEAMGMLRDRYPRLHLAICGRGELGDALAALAREKGLADRVHLLGLRSDVAAILSAADTFVLPSLSEGLPLALLEAMFARRPIVASAVGEVSAVLEQGEAGLLVEPGNASTLATALDRLLSDADLASALGERAGRRADAEYHVTQMVRRYVQIYDELAGSRHSLGVQSCRVTARAARLVAGSLRGMSFP